MTLRALSAAALALLLIAVPISIEWVIQVALPIAAKVAWATVEPIGLAQLVIAALTLPIIVIVKLEQRWPGAARVAFAVGVVALAVLWFSSSERGPGCPSGPKSACGEMEPY